MLIVTIIVVLHADLPCCPTIPPPEPNRIGRCQQVRTKQLCRGGARSHSSRMCPVACGRCVICAGHELFDVYSNICAGGCVRGGSILSALSALSSSTGNDTTARRPLTVNPTVALSVTTTIDAPGADKVKHKRKKSGGPNGDQIVAHLASQAEAT